MGRLKGNVDWQRVLLIGMLVKFWIAVIVVFYLMAE